jgi:phenylacetate-CoA ligase
MLNYLKAYLLYPAAERYLKRNIRSKLLALRRESQLSNSERSQRRQGQLHAILTTAKSYVPYYRDLFAQISFDPDSILKSTDYLQELPLLTKEILREQGTRMLSEKHLGGLLHERHTNGSTGLITKVWYDQDALDWTAAVNLFASEISGRKQSDTEVHLSSQFSDKIPFKSQLVEQVKCWSLNRVNVHTQTFDDRGLAKLLRDLKWARPYSIQGHPSSLYFLAIYAKNIDARARGIFRAFESTGESLDASKVRLIEDTFGCRVFNRYGNAEFGVVAHSQTDFNRLEVLDSIILPESHSLGNGLEELVLTGLTNHAMPLIRYKTGDVGEVSFENDHYFISRLTGRVHDLVVLNGNTYPTHYIKDVLERMGGLDEFQIVQRGTETIKTLRVVPNGAFNRSQVENRMRELFGDDLRVECVNFDGLIMQGWRDKFRYLVKIK